MGLETKNISIIGRVKSDTKQSCKYDRDDAIEIIPPL